MTTPHAFPQIKSQTAGDLSVTEVDNPGMELRDYFAIRVLAAFLTSEDVIRPGDIYTTDNAYDWADRMIESRAGRD